MALGALLGQKATSLYTYKEVAVPASWVGNTQSVPVAGLKASDIVVSGYSPRSAENLTACRDAQIDVKQENGSITVICKTPPEVTVYVYLLILN